MLFIWFEFNPFDELGETIVESDSLVVLFLAKVARAGISLALIFSEQKLHPLGSLRAGGMQK
jgi:hypothetical protein